MYANVRTHLKDQGRIKVLHSFYHSQLFDLETVKTRPTCKGAVNERKVIDEAVIRMTRFGRIDEFTDGAIRNVGDLMKQITLRIRRNLLFFDQIT